MAPRRLKDVDHTDMIYRMRSAPFAFIFGLLAAGGASVAHMPWYLVILVGIGAFCAVLFLPTYLANKTGDVGAAIYTPSGRSTPSIAEYSLAESMVARGRYDDAAEAYGLLSEDYPHDPEPPLRYARLLRDKMQRFEDAATWYKRALAVEDIKEATEVAATRELIELYTHKLKTPERALQYLSKIPEKYPNNPAAAWARQEYLEIKSDMQDTHDDG